MLTYVAYKTVRRLSKSDAETPSIMMGFSVEDPSLGESSEAELSDTSNMSEKVSDFRSWYLCTLNCTFSI